ncbi:MAG: hypothetical protein Q7S19_02515 [bacterium]|nr:hypothetical protein [bacterium]
MFEPISYAIAAVAAAFTAPLLAALGGEGMMPPPLDGNMMPPPGMTQPMVPSNQMFPSPGGQNFMPQGGQQQFQQFQPNQMMQKDGGDFNGGQQQFQPNQMMQRDSGQFRFGQPQDGQQGMMPQGGRQQFEGDQPESRGEPQNGSQRDNEGSDDSEKRMKEDEDRQDKMEKQQEERERQMEKQRLSQVKRMIGGGMKQGMTMMKKMIATAQKQGISVPAEYLTLISDVESAIKVIEGATEMNDAVMEATETLQDKGEELRDIGPQIGMLTQWPKILKDAEKQITQVKKLFTTAKNKAKKSKVDISDIVSKVEAKIAEIEKIKNDLKAEVGGKDVDYEDIMERMHEEVFAAMDDLRDDMNTLQNIGNITSQLKRVDKDLKSYATRANNLTKAKKNTTHLKELLAEANKKSAAVKAIIAKPGFDPETLFEAISDGEGLINDINDELAELEGRETDLDKQFNYQDPFASQGQTGTSAAQ